MSVFVANCGLHVRAGLKRTEFLTRLLGLEAIRAGSMTVLTTYPSSFREWRLISRISKFVREGTLVEDPGARDHPVVFAFEFSDELYRLFNDYTASELERYVTLGVAYLWAMKPDNHRILSSQIYAPVLEEARHVAAQYPMTDDPVSFENALRSYVPGFVPPAILDDHRQYCVNNTEPGYARSSLSLPLRSPCFGCDDDFGARATIAYLTDVDWAHIVLLRDLSGKALTHKKRVAAQNDTLLRVESDMLLWERWRVTEAQFVAGGTGVYSLFSAPATPKGTVYLVRDNTTGLTKIGWTRGPVGTRVKSLQTGASSPLVVINSFAVSSAAVERALHRRFDEKRATGEWFQLTPAEIAMIGEPSWRRSNGVV